MKKIFTLFLCLLLLQGCTSNQKVIEQSTDPGTVDAATDENWVTYTDKNSGFSFRHPKELQPNPSGDQEHELFLGVTATPIDQLEKEETMGYDRATALKDQQALSQGQWGEDIDEPLRASQQVVSVEEVPAKKFTVLGRFEVCSVTFDRILIFYHNNRQVVVTLSGSSDVLKKEMPQYFRKDPANCGDILTWNFDKQTEFYETLAAHKGSPKVQQWFDVFDKIVSTIKIEDSK